MTDEDKKYGLRKGARFSEAEVAFLELTCRQFNMTESDVIRSGPPAIHFIHTLLSRIDEIHALCVEFVSTLPRKDMSSKTLSPVVAQTERRKGLVAQIPTRGDRRALCAI